MFFSCCLIRPLYGRNVPCAGPKICDEVHYAEANPCSDYTPGSARLRTGNLKLARTSLRYPLNDQPVRLAILERRLRPEFRLRYAHVEA